MRKQTFPLGLTVGTTGVELLRGGELRTAFETVALDDRFAITVPTLVRISRGSLRAKYDFTVEDKQAENLGVRVLATCVDTECKQVWLQDEPERGRLASDFFKPRKGRVIAEDALPSTLLHQFGIMGYLLEEPQAMYAEVAANPNSGRISRIG